MEVDRNIVAQGRNIEEYASCAAEVWYDPDANWTERVDLTGTGNVHKKTDKAAPQVSVVSARTSSE